MVEEGQFSKSLTLPRGPLPLSSSGTVHFNDPILTADPLPGANHAPCGANHVPLPPLEVAEPKRIL